MTDRSLTDNDRLADAIARDIEEMERVEKLSNVRLVAEILDRLPFTDMDQLIEEACARLDPEWNTRGSDEPLSPEDEAMLKRCYERSMAMFEEIRRKSGG